MTKACNHSQLDPRLDYCIKSDRKPFKCSYDDSIWKQSKEMIQQAKQHFMQSYVPEKGWVNINWSEDFGFESSPRPVDIPDEEAIKICCPLLNNYIIDNKQDLFNRLYWSLKCPCTDPKCKETLQKLWMKQNIVDYIDTLHERLVAEVFHGSFLTDSLIDSLYNNCQETDTDVDM